MKLVDKCQIRNVGKKGALFYSSGRSAPKARCLTTISVRVMLVTMFFFICEASGKPLKILLVSPYTTETQRGIKTLLDKNGAEVTISQWGQVGTEWARVFDLVIVSGWGRALLQGDSLPDFDGAVMGMGSYGCTYFGKFKLKNGLPYT